ncbi:ASCH domain-containing protein [Roseivivax isoporae]|uniref:ASCH domain-containing protein n=1 Tax=Roseivivax isoporae LMG 25204 TaxID=1449351 RepID=X7F1F3_9RHOB|nr:ASCH domain-containing protein [Roseivivax isoporae]ETX26590.1 hypothetical protein RISW2_21860 [Roseivivax isoporae LMG 25204]
MLPEKALSVRQPWAWAIMFAGKDIENRSWQAVNHGLSVCGEIVLHAAKGMTQQEYEDAADFMASIGVTCPPPYDLWRGAVIGTVEVVDVVRESASPWFFGPRGLVLRNPKPVAPVAVNGALGYFDWQSRRTDQFPEPARWMLPRGRPQPEAPRTHDLFTATERERPT